MTLSKTRKDFATEEEYRKYRDIRNKSERERLADPGKKARSDKLRRKWRTDPKNRARRNKQEVERRGKIRPEINKTEVERRGKIRPEINKAEREKTRELKTKVMSHYSNGEIHCIHCGETKIDFLTIDHINGRKVWKERGGDKKGDPLYRWLRRNDFPDGFQVLCWTWNQIKTKKEREIKRKRTPRAKHDRERNLNDKIEALTVYSEGDKPQCCCCKYDELDGLTIHHKYGRKNAPIEEQELYGDKMYRFLRDKGYPKGHHLTWCFNCNSAASEEGICPHQNMRKNS